MAARLAAAAARRRPPTPRGSRRAGVGLGALGLGLASVAAWPPPPASTPASLADPASFPDDPEYGYVTATDPVARRSGQWELYSFLPDRSLALPAPPTQELAAGASIDLAWATTIGSPRAILTVADAGLDWSDRDLLSRVRLNIGELRSATAAPLRGDGTPCAPLDPSQPTLDPFDCDGDGVLTVNDYRDHPSLLPKDSTPPGDTNGNGVLDAQDLLAQRFLVNGTDDDGNGYPDDIAGWDFVDDDNDAGDPTASGRGTGLARRALATANDGWGYAGACPACRLLPLRVGGGGSLDPQRLGQALAYATEQDVAVVAVAAETLGTSPHLRAALDYAWAAGTLVVVSSGHDGSRRPADLSAAVPVLSIGAVTLGGVHADSTTATSFLAASPCSNFGGQLVLSAPSASCPPEGAGLVAGIGGLLRAASSSVAATTPRLTPGELRQLLVANADDVDLLESRREGSTLAWSQPGFDQRFGFGRVNAARAVAAVVTGRIPPDIAVTAPRPFDVLGRRDATSPLSITGTISARRALSYDYTVEYAPGVQPEATAFRVLATRTGQAPTTVSGDVEPLARLDVRTIDATHEPDPDSPRGEHATLLTLRVRATARYGEPIGDVSAEVRRVVTVERDPDTYPGFPRPLAGAGVASPQLGDVDGDGLPELVLATTAGELHVWSFARREATSLPGFPFRTAPLVEPRGAAYGSTAGIDPALLRESIVAAPALGDVTGDGQVELVVATRAGQLYLIDRHGELLPGWPRRLPDVELPCSPPCRGNPQRPRDLLGSPVLAELDALPGLEILLVGFDDRVHALRADGTPLRGWPVELVVSPAASSLAPWSTPVVADFTGDGVPDLLTGTELPAQGAARYVLVDGRGNASPQPIVEGWPLETASWPLLPGAGLAARLGAAAGDFDDDGRADAVLQGHANRPWILPATPGHPRGLDEPPDGALPLRDPATQARGVEYAGRFGADSDADGSLPMTPLLSLPAVADLDQDGVLDLIATGASQDVAERLAWGIPRTGPGQHLLALWSGRSGEMLPGSPSLLEGLSWLGGVAIVDLTGDDYPEVLVGTEGNLLHAIDACGRQPKGWPKRTGQWIAAAPAVADLDGDGHLEVAVVTRAGWLHLWRTTANRDALSPWPVQRHDAHNTGSATTRNPGRRSLGDVPPLPIDPATGHCLSLTDEEAPAAPNGELVPRGGCGCAVGARPRGGPVSLWPLVCSTLALGARRRGRGR